MPRRNLLNEEKSSLIDDIENNGLKIQDVKRIYRVCERTVFRCLENKKIIKEEVAIGHGKRAR